MIGLPEHARLINKQGTERIIALDENQRVSYSEIAYLAGFPDDDEEKATILLGGPRSPDSTGREMVTVMRDIAFKFHDGSITTIIPVDDVIMEYRKTVGEKKTRGKGDLSYESTYGVTMVMIGVREERWQAIMDGLASQYKSFLSDEEGERMSNGYVWIDASTSVKVPEIDPGSDDYDAFYKKQCFVLRPSGDGTLKKKALGSFRNVLKIGKQNIIGSAYLTLRLKATAKPGKTRYKFRLGATIKHFQVKDFTDVKSPSVNVDTNETTYRKNVVVAPTFMKLLMERNRKFNEEAEEAEENQEEDAEESEEESQKEEGEEKEEKEENEENEPVKK
jgi:hypothetical protein